MANMDGYDAAAKRRIIKFLDRLFQAETLEEADAILEEQVQYWRHEKARKKDEAARKFIEENRDRFQKAFLEAEAERFSEDEDAKKK